MNKTFAMFAVAAAGICAMPGAQAKDLTGWFVNAGAGRVNYHATVGQYDLGSDHGTAGILNVGYRTQFIGFEAGYTNLGSLKAGEPGVYRDKLSGDGWTAGINGHFNLTPQWYVSARAGLFSWKLHATETVYDNGASQTSKASTQATNGYAGIGTGYDINRHWSVGAAFDYYDISKRSDIGRLEIGNRVFSVNAEYRF
ncbi:outer membrane beta-barrel protein [Rhodanobacter sp. T12-5]|uniref:outer membrane beta-barrel protein n=1 Tax=Rhodanobacter sp. T12-5 TaxID=2024611 RepID=UPI0011EBD0F7|nr:outer membrane beta-barrel protein [Rhodanobacter sp. T12-5]KAA0072024.1 porin family protein [Rhodanobacter sp. T12-5]